MRKHIICFGDSNTYGQCADPTDCADGGDRFNEDERWPCLLQKKLGDAYYVTEEGLPGRTTVFDDPHFECLSGLDSIYCCLVSHAPVDLLVIMLGTNDCKEHLGQNPCGIGYGLDRLLQRAKSIDCWRDGKPNIFVIAPPHIREGFDGEYSGYSSVEKSEKIAKYMEQRARLRGAAFLDAEGIAEVNTVDFCHLTRKGHADLAEKLSEIVQKLI